jgi:hypothetical protein
MGSCQVSCRPETISEVSSICQQDKTNTQKTTKSEPQRYDRKVNSNIVMITESVGSELALKEERVPVFVMFKQINEPIKPRRNRFTEDVEDEVKRRIKEMYTRFLIYRVDTWRNNANATNNRSSKIP